MLMPILRLVLIYLVLILVVVGVFNRDKVSRLLFGGDAPAASAPAQLAEPVVPAAAPAADTGHAATPAPATTAQPVYPSDTQAAAPAQPAAPTPSPVQPTAAQEQTAEPALQMPGRNIDPEVAEAINAARSAYWTGDLTGAENQLVALIAKNPDNADLFGELGNLHFSQRRYPEAGESFARAAELLIEQGNRAQAMSLVPMLRQIAPERAQALASQLQSR